MQILNYGSGYISMDLPEARILGIIEPRSNLNLAHDKQMALVKEALAYPVDAPQLRSLAGGKSNAVVVVSDNTRLAPTTLLLDCILNELHEAGLQPENITVVVGVGNHKRLSDKALSLLLGPEIYGRYPCINSSDSSYVRMGVTTRGTPVEVCREVAEAQLCIFTGNMEPHRLAGISGGAKACIGISSPEAIEQNHKLMELGASAPGQLAGNPVRSDLEEYAQIVGVDFILNVVVDNRGNVEKAAAGHVVYAHRALCRYAEEKYSVPCSQPADLVIASAGGQPKDGNLYQAVKALQNAVEITKPQGITILAAECAAGFGDDIFRAWVTDAHGLDQVLVRGQREFQLGGHKAVMLAKLIKDRTVFLVSALPADEVRKLGMAPFQDLQIAVEVAMTQLKEPKVWIIPYAGVTFPRVVVPAGKH